MTNQLATKRDGYRECDRNRELYGYAESQEARPDLDLGSKEFM